MLLLRLCKIYRNKVEIENLHIYKRWIKNLFVFLFWLRGEYIVPSIVQRTSDKSTQHYSLNLLTAASKSKARGGGCSWFQGAPFSLLRWLWSPESLLASQEETHVKLFLLTQESSSLVEPEWKHFLTHRIRAEQTCLYFTAGTGSQQLLQPQSQLTSSWKY